MKTKSTPALAASAIRKELKALLPTKKFSITSERFSMGSSVTVRAQDLSPEESKIVKNAIEKYQYGSFCGMQDMYEITNNRDDLPQVKYVSLENSISVEMKQKLVEFIQKNLAGFENLTLDNVNQQRNSLGVWANEYINALFYGRSGYDNFWNIGSCS